MAPPELRTLRKLLGDAWVDAEVFGKNPFHWLGRWQKKDSNNIWVTYAEALVRAILACKNISFDPEVLANRLKSPSDIVSLSRHLPKWNQQSSWPTKVSQ